MPLISLYSDSTMNFSSTRSRRVPGPDSSLPGFKHFFLQPEVDPTGYLNVASGHYDSMYGRIESRWERKEASTEYSFTIPANTSATVVLPAKSLKDVKVDGRKVNRRTTQASLDKAKGLLKMELGSGSYQIEVANE